MQPHNGQQTWSQPDIHSILRTLAQSHTKPSSSVASQGSVATRPERPERTSTAPVADETDEYDPAQFIPEDPKAPAKPPPPALKDPSTITTWAPALRHVTALIARDDSVVAHLQKMRRSQAEHERQWWDGRRALVEMQANRGMGRKRIEDILKGVGGSIATTVQGQTPEDDVAELKRYDAKVYRVLTQMNEAMGQELKTMGIPFFCIKSSLVVEPAKDDAPALSDSTPAQATLSPDELKHLQLRMVETLEDLSGV